MPKRGDLTPFYNNQYIDELFLIWYKKGRLSPKALYAIMPENKDGDKPSQATLTKWIRSEWLERATFLDDQVRQGLEDKMVAEKVEMLSRHAVIGVEMQNRALIILKDKELKINASTAVRLLVEGVEMERESRGVSTALEKMMNTTDEELLNRIEDILERSPVEISKLSE